MEQTSEKLLDVKNEVDCSKIDPVYFEFLYSPDPSEPNGITRRGKIFNISSADFNGRDNSALKLKFTQADSFKSRELNLALNFDVSAQYKAFSGAASMNLETQSQGQFKTMRKDNILRAYQCEIDTVGFFHAAPEKFILPHFRYVIEHSPAEKIARDYGAFYAKKVVLGGEFRRTYLMQRSKEDNTQTFESEIQAAYGKKDQAIHGNAGLDGKIHNRKYNKNGRIKRTITWKGGYVMGLLAPLDDKDTNRNNEWVKSFNNNNLYAFKYNLRPIWEIVKAVNLKKGEELEEILKAKWGTEFGQFSDAEAKKEFVPSNVDLVNKHPSRIPAKKKARDRYYKCNEEESNANSWMNNWWYRLSKTRYKNMRNAARSCKAEMERIKAELNGKKSVQEFKKWLTDVLNKRQREGNRRWGIGGYNSALSNRVNKDTFKAEQEIRKLFD